MSSRGYEAVLNPFSREAKKILKDAPPFDSLSERVIERAINRVEQKSGPEAKVDLEEKAIREEVLSFYLMCQSVAAVSYPYSAEARAVADATRDTIEYRMYDFFRRGKEDFCLDVIRRSFRFRELESEDGAKLGSIAIPREDLYKLRDLALKEDGVEISEQTVDDRIVSKYMPRYAVKWTDLGSLIKYRQIDLTKQYVVKGWTLITPKELWEFFANAVSDELVEYISSLYNKFSETGSPSDLLEEVGRRISDAVPEETRGGTARLEVGELRSDCFPPCVKKTIRGIGSGNRNYGIVVLLTSFLSYARISPSGRAVRRIADFVDDISVIEDEVIPLVFEAAEKCRPPLFEDQPQDKANVYYHLGFGMTEQPRLRDSGKSKWYRPPNCRKIRTEAPSLCVSNDMCSQVKNPLTYYYKKLSEDSKSG